MNFNMFDQNTLNFVRNQASHVEAGVYRQKYADIQYQELIPIDTSAPAWVKTVTFMSMDKSGMAEWISGSGDDIPMVGVNANQFESGVHMAGIGYDWNIEEVNQAMMLGYNLPSEKASAARRAYEEFVDSHLLHGTRPDGSATKGLSGLISYPGITAAAAANGGGGQPDWPSKTADEVLLDINNALAGVWIDTLNIEVCDTLLLSEESFLHLANKRIPNTDTTLLQYVLQNNILRMRYGRDLTIRVIRGLTTAGAGSTRRMVVYRRDPEVLKAHIPMPLRFLPVQVRNLQFAVPGLFRFGGLDIRRESAVRYVDGI